MPLVCVPQSHKNFYKFWWGEELKIAKAQSVESNNIWKAVGKPRQGLVFEKRNKYRLAYQQLIREEQKREKLSYTNDLHDALLKKDGRTFWNCWRSKFERSAPCSQVEGVSMMTLLLTNFHSTSLSHIIITIKVGPIHSLISIHVHAANTVVHCYQIVMLLILN